MLGLVNKVASVIHHPHSPFAKSDKKILDDIYTTHVHADDSFNDDSLFIIVESILKRATQTVDKIVQDGKKKRKWSACEDQILSDYVKKHGPGKWGKIAKEIGLGRCGKSVRL